jgi:hypothetical protein
VVWFPLPPFNAQPRARTKATRATVAESSVSCLAASMTGSTDLEPSETESWTPQHWSRQEWFYMWTKGLDIWRIAVLCRVPYRKVYEHIRNRIAYHPELFGQRLMLHDHPQLPPGGLKKQKPKIPWTERVQQLAEFKRAHGRFPRGYIKAEQQLYTFMQYQRQQYRAGKLPEPRKFFLDEHVSGWLTPPKREREEALWQQRAREMETFLRANRRYPQYKTAADSSERVLAVWLERQRHCLKRGKLEIHRESWLDGHLPSSWLNVTREKRTLQTRP